jgi:hypothetical protein
MELVGGASRSQQFRVDADPPLGWWSLGVARLGAATKLEQLYFKSLELRLDLLRRVDAWSRTQRFALRPFLDFLGETLREATVF